MKLDRLLVAVDFSDSSLAAAQWAVRILAPQAKFLLFHATSGAAPPGFLRDVLPARNTTLEEIRSDADAGLLQLAAALPTDSVEIDVAAGRPAEQIARAAARWGADLILLGPHGHRYCAYDPVGSTAEALVRSCPVPALIARGTPDDPVGRIIAAIDESIMTRRVLDWAGFFLDRLAGARLVLVHVLDLGLYGALGTARSTDGLEELQQRAEHAAREWLGALAKDANFDLERVQLHAASGDPKFEIVAAAEQHNADLLIMGSRGAADVGLAHLGGVASAVLRGSHASVLVVTGPDDPLRRGAMDRFV